MMNRIYRSSPLGLGGSANRVVRVAVLKDKAFLLSTTREQGCGIQEWQL